jgi:anthranilate synthase/aminodeoxychorismate synthase-like glutamine amidotransferase
VPRILVIDSYDSFVYNLVQYLGELGADPIVVRNDELTVDEAIALAPDGVLLSPGPGRPEDGGIICDSIPAFAEAGTPVFGVCLGHQAIGHVFGASVVGAPELMHGKTSAIDHEGAGVFAGLPSPLTATRYHSLTLDPETISSTLAVTARSALRSRLKRNVKKCAFGATVSRSCSHGAHSSPMLCPRWHLRSEKLVADESRRRAPAPATVPHSVQPQRIRTTKLRRRRAIRPRQSANS